MAIPGKKAPQNLSSTPSRGFGEDFEVFCQSCDRDDLRLPAAGYCADCEEHLCDACFNTHRRPKPRRHHKLLDKAHMPKSQTLSTTSGSARVGQSHDLTDPCTKHKNEVIKFYCNDHKALLCSVCVTLEHTPTSCRVDYIPDLSGQTIDSTGSKDTLKELGKADRLFIEIRNAEQMIQENKKRISQLTKAKNINEYMFKPSPAIETLLQNEISLGTLTPILLKQPGLPPVTALKLRTTSSPRNICVKTSLDQCDCFITGMTTSYIPHQIFLADYDNYSIKMVDTNSQSIQQLSLDSRPRDVTTITRDELAVTMPDIQTIQLLSFSSNRLSKENTIKTDGNCYGISCYQEKLVVTFQDPDKLKIMDVKGTVLATVTKNSSGENIFSCPEYVTTNSHSIYVSDWGKHEVIWLNWEGELLGSYGGLGFPRGLAMLTGESFFVSDARFDKRNILNMTGDCRESKIVLKVLNYPWALCWCDASKLLYVSSNYIYDEDTNNLIQIYKMS